MAILEPSEATPPRVQCVREVRIDVWYEKAAVVREFYQEVLGMPAWPPLRQIPGGWGVGDPTCGLYFQYRHDPPKADPLRRRFSLVTDSLDAIEKRLIERQIAHTRVHGFGVTDQTIWLNDPNGYRIEIRQSQAI